MRAPKIALISASVKGSGRGGTPCSGGGGVGREWRHRTRAGGANGRVAVGRGNDDGLMTGGETVVNNFPVENLYEDAEAGARRAERTGVESKPR